MLKRVKMSRCVLGLAMLSTLVVCCSSCRSSGSPTSGYVVKLSRGGYSPSTNRLVLIAGSYFAAYDMETAVTSVFLEPTSEKPADFAWVPGQDAFVITRIDQRIILYRRDASGTGYDGTAIACPVGVTYDACAWNPAGEWLAVVCSDYRKEPFATKLGLYKAKEQQFVITDIGIRIRPLVWKDDVTLHAFSDNGLLEMRLDSGVAKVVRAIPLGEEAAWFYGVFDDQALVMQCDGKLKLGEKTLIQLDNWGLATIRVMATETAIFVSPSTTNLIAFDSRGREIDRTNPGKEIRFGSIGKDQNTVYGVAGSVLLRITVENGRLSVQEVSDLKDAEQKINGE